MSSGSRKHVKWICLKFERSKNKDKSIERTQVMYKFVRFLLVRIQAEFFIKIIQ